MTAAIPAIDSRAGWQAALLWGLETAMQRQARCITCVAPCFDTWPLDAPTLLPLLTQWLRLPQRRLMLLARHYDEVPRRFPRFTALRRAFVHAVEPWQVPDELASDLPILLLDDGDLCVHLVDDRRWRGQAALDPRLARLWRERVVAFLQRSASAFPASTLGL